VNLTHQDRKDLAEALQNPERHSFDRAQKAIFILMIDGTFDYFLNSGSYQQAASMFICPIAQLIAAHTNRFNLWCRQ
jgi:hypothetical protein